MMERHQATGFRFQSLLMPEAGSLDKEETG